MARPSKNNCDYFPHDNDMRNHVKVKAIRNKFKNGYAIWVMFLEYLTSADGNVFEYTDMQFELLSGDFGFNSNEIKEVIDYALKLEMIFNKNGFVNSDSLDVRLEPVYIKRGKSKEQSAKQKRINGKFISNNADSTIVSATEIPQSKVKESKVDENNEEEYIFNAKKFLLSIGVDKIIASDFLKVRKLKKAANTETAFKSIKLEIEKTNLTANECITICVQKSWASFKSEWVQTQQISFHTNSKDNRKLDEYGYETL